MTRSEAKFIAIITFILACILVILGIYATFILFPYSPFSYNMESFSAYLIGAVILIGLGVLLLVRAREQAKKQK